MDSDTSTRRNWLRRCGWALAMGAGLPNSWASDAADDNGDGPGRAVSKPQLLEMLKPHFPVGYQVAGFLTLRVQQPRLDLLSQDNRMNADMDVVAEGPALNRPQTGQLNVGFGLRYEASDRTVRAHQLRFNSLQFPGLRPEASALIQVYGPALTEAALQEVVLHQLEARDLTMLDALGLRPGKIRITDTGLHIAFEPKPL
ncbi:DUF1439 domain-containing protein [Hydrogenophaga sp. PAMC20947]|uniref:DUF1439 domain-containing protein n=1 Tax=Hydrogenophaga sp. PAMC20947 TaxID=2565558 RepID=UPI00109DB6FC|nr:DUF1439 domain-containing protein [Hydrogenophaga sp. PAMC20947]QCB47868.1 DUF1439 domain-containing protein [Hydrogenophaga sp. PAMC20947]